jgi:hypothetical protein
VQLGAETNARRNSTPSRATRSNAGVWMMSFTVPGPSSLAQALACSPQSSAKTKRMLGRDASAALALAAMCERSMTASASRKQ